MSWRRFSILLIALFSVSAVASAQTIQSAEVAMPDGRHLVIEGSQTGEPLWVVYLPGSGASIFPASQSLWLKTFAEAGHSQVMVINKAGVPLTGALREPEFDASALRPVRIGDVQYILQKYIPANATIWLVGESEGAYIAPDVALNDSRITKLFLVSAGTRSWIDEEISFAPPAQQTSVREFLQTQVIGHPSLTQSYDGWTYAQLDSYNTRQTFFSLQALRLPVLMLNGQLDHDTWVAATTADATELIQTYGKTNIEFHLIEGVNHALGCDAGNADCQPGVVSHLEVDFFNSFMSKN